MSLDAGLVEARKGGRQPLAEPSVGVLRDDERDSDRATGGALFACPAGVREGEFVGQRLFEQDRG